MLTLMTRGKALASLPYRFAKAGPETLMIRAIRATFAAQLVSALLLLLAALPASATVDAWPALFDVTGVAEDDVLNIRAGPTVGHEVIGTLGPEARRIEIIEASRNGRWGRVNTGGRSGWVSMAYLQRRPEQWFGAIPDIAACFGTEPFWRLDLGTDWRMTMPEGDEYTARPGDMVGSLSHRGRFAATAQLADGRTTMLTVLNQSCSDGMSDRRYGFEGLVMTTGEPPNLRAGCCSLSE